MSSVEAEAHGPGELAAAEQDRGLLVSLLQVLSFFFNDTATTEIYTLSLHDALPISETSCWRSAKSITIPIAFSSDARDRKSTRLNSSHVEISYAVFCLKKKIKN